MKQSQTRRQTTPIAPVSEDIHDLKRLDPLPAFRASSTVRSVCLGVCCNSSCGVVIVVRNTVESLC